jgi:ParB family chromosome partitioning protein
MSSSQRHGLGRGLGALIPQSGAPEERGVDMVDIELITPNPEQPRLHFDQAALEELAASIREHGVLQPVIVTRVTSELGPAAYQLIAGERRLQAARIAGVEKMPVVIKEAAGNELLELALVENLQRQDLNPIEEAIAFKRLSDEFSMTQEQIAQRVGRSRTAVANIMRLLSLAPDIRASIASGQISEGHARALLAIDDEKERIDAWRKIVADGMSVRDAEDVARALRALSGQGTRSTSKTGRTAGAPARGDAHLRDLESRLRVALGTRVMLTKSKRGGRIVIRFHNDEELEGLIDRLTE